MSSTHIVLTLTTVLCTCKRCHTFYRKWKARNDRNELVHEERDHPIVKFYSLVVDIRNCILKSMPKLAEVMNRMTSNPVKATPDDYEVREGAISIHTMEEVANIVCTISNFLLVSRWRCDWTSLWRRSLRT